MGYILVTARKRGNPVVTWNTSLRIEGKATPVRTTTYLGLLDGSGTKLVRSSDIKELSPEILAGLEKKYLGLSAEAAAPRGRKAVLLRRMRLDDLAETRIETVGTYRILRGLAEACGFFQSLHAAFMEDGDAVFALMCQRLDSRMQGYLFRDWSEDTPFALARLSMSPKAVGSLLCRIENRRLAFCQAWYKACGSPRELVGASTHFCTCGRTGGGRECEEYGWDHRQEAGRRQVNVMSLVARSGRLPVMYRAYPGSINNISTFTETEEEMKAVGGDASILYVPDSGYFSSLDMRLMVKNGHDFVMEVKWDTQTLAILAAKRGALMGPGEYVKHGSYTYRSEPCAYSLFDRSAGGRKATISGYIFYSELEAGQLRNSLRTTAMLWQKAFRRYDFESAAQAQEWLDTCTDGFGKYLRLAGVHPALDTELDNSRIAKDTERFGFHVAVTTVKDMAAADIMEICHGRDPVEKLWRTMKSDLDAKALMTKIDPATQGQIFIVWGAAILYRLLADALERAGLDMTVDEALLTMRKIRMMCMKDRIIAQTPPRKAKDIVVGLGLERDFPEYAECLRSCLEERERLGKAQEGRRHRGRPPKFKLKTSQRKTTLGQNAVEEEKLRKKAATPRRTGRPPIK